MFAEYLVAYLVVRGDLMKFHAITACGERRMKLEKET